MRKLLIAALLALLWAGRADAQMCNGCGIGYWYASLPLTGGTLTGPLSLSDGTAAAPSLAFGSDSTLGIYKRAANILGFSAAGAAKWNIGTSSFYPETTDTQAIGITANQVLGISVSRYIQGGKSKALTDAAAATPYVTVAVPTNGWVAGELIWAATSLSGADQLTATGRVRFAGATTAGTPVCTIGVVGTDLQAVSGGVNTLVCTWTNVVAAQTCALSVTCTNNLAAAQAITLYGRTNMPITATLLFP